MTNRNNKVPLTISGISGPSVCPGQLFGISFLLKHHMFDVTRPVVLYTQINRLKRKNKTNWLRLNENLFHSNLLKNLNLLLSVKNGFSWIKFYSLK